jgi:hypothetical protein
LLFCSPASAKAGYGRHNFINSFLFRQAKQNRFFLKAVDRIKGGKQIHNKVVIERWHFEGGHSESLALL